MSKEDFWKALGRSRFDLDFSGRFQNDPEQTLAEAGYVLDAAEVQALKNSMATRAIMSPEPAASDFSEYEMLQKQKELLIRQMERRDRLIGKAHEVVEQTFDNAARTFKAITMMNKITFATGISLFIFSALYAVYAEQKVYSLLFGGLGVATFVALFILGPVERTQKALSNLVQVEIAFMSYFDQIVWWETFASLPTGTPPAPDPANIEKASLALEARSLALMQMLQRYVEGDDSGTEVRPRRKSKVTPISGGSRAPGAE